MPASLLHSRPFRVSRSGIGSFDMRRYFAQVPVYLRLIAAGKVDAHVYPLSHVSEAWTAPKPRPSGGRWAFTRPTVSPFPWRAPAVPRPG